MACIDEEIPKFKHYCRVCKKGFMCGRALGGHMRAHGIGDIENGILDYDDDDDDNDASDSEEKYGGSDQGTGIKRMYKLRTNPNRLKSCRNCEHCGKEFLSWKSFLEHGKCVSDDTSESLLSSPLESAGEDDGGRCVGGWSKRKRSFRVKVDSFNSASSSSEKEDLHLARCLMQLANTKVDLPMVAEPEESCASASREEEERRNPKTFFDTITGRPHLDNRIKGPTPKGFFECKACKKVFNSHQALGGHRASHKKVKGCYAAKQEQQQDETILADDDDVITHKEFLTPSKATSSYQYEQAPAFVGAAKRKSKVHECSICRRVFSSGQALGGHKRCHWITSNSPETSSLAKFQFQDKNTYPPIQTRPKTNAGQSGTLDLNNFPTCTDRDSSLPHESQLEYHNNNNNNNVISNKINENNIINADDKMKNLDNDEADCKLKYAAKLSELKDLKDSGDNSSQWLQVGIGSTTKAVVDV